MGWRVLLLVLAVGGGSARGVELDDEAARNHFLAGKSYFTETRYDDALREFNEAFRLSRRVELQYNIGVCEERLGRLTEAVAALRAYLDALPHADDRVEVEGRIADLEARQRRERSSEPPTVTPPGPPVQPQTTPAPATPAPAPTVAAASPPSRPTVSVQEGSASPTGPCTAGQKLVEGHCCWPGQSWASRRQICVGPPECPPGWHADMDMCFAPTGAPDADARAGTQLVTFSAFDEESHFKVAVTDDGTARSCITPCSLHLAPGTTVLSVGTFDSLMFQKPIELPPRPSMVRVNVRCTSCYIGGAIVFALGLGGAITALELGDTGSSSASTKIPSIVIPAVAGVLALLGVVVFASGGVNKAEVVDSGK